MPSNESIRISNGRLPWSGPGSDPITRVPSNIAWFLLAIATVLTAPAASYANTIPNVSVFLNADGLTTTGDYIYVTNPGTSGSVTTADASASYGGGDISSVTATSSSSGGLLPSGTTGIYAQA